MGGLARVPPHYPLTREIRLSGPSLRAAGKICSGSIGTRPRERCLVSEPARSLGLSTPLVRATGSLASPTPNESEPSPQPGPQPPRDCETLALAEFSGNYR
jgi:hypothetical protein